MIEQIYGWLKDMVFYLLIITAVLEVIPGGNYQKYIRFFTGMVLILLLLTPVLALTNMRELFAGLYQDYSREWENQGWERQAQDLEDRNLFEFLPEEYQGITEGEAEEDFRENAERTEAGKIRAEAIEVEEIKIGKEVE